VYKNSQGREGGEGKRHLSRKLEKYKGGGSGSKWKDLGMGGCQQKQERAINKKSYIWGDVTVDVSGIGLAGEG